MDSCLKFYIDVAWVDPVDPKNDLFFGMYTQQEVLLGAAVLSIAIVAFARFKG